MKNIIFLVALVLFSCHKKDSQTEVPDYAVNISGNYKGVMQESGDSATLTITEISKNLVSVYGTDYAHNPEPYAPNNVIFLNGNCAVTASLITPPSSALNYIGVGASYSGKNISVKVNLNSNDSWDIFAGTRQ